MFFNNREGVVVPMKRKIGIMGLALMLVVNITACSLPILNNKKDKEATKKEETSDKEAKDKEENVYSPIIAKDVKAADAEYPYMLKINKAFNCITVYTLDDKKEYTLAVRSLICSTGGSETPDGTFQLGESVEWAMLPEGNYGRYVTRVVDNVVIRSVDYLAQSEDALDVPSYNSLGDTVSGSAIVLGDADAKWIADNCPEGTKVEIYSDDKEAGPLGKPLARLIPDDVTWDPTDPSSENAWYVPVSFKGIEDKVIKVGETPDFLDGVTAKDKYCNDLTAAIKVYGEVDVNKPGKYKITYSCENSDGNKRDVSINVKVVDKDSDVTAQAAEEPTEEPTQAPTETPTQAPTKAPEVTQAATPQPTVVPTQAPTQAPARTGAPTQKPTTVTTVTTVQIVDNEAPVVRFVASSPYVSSLSDGYLANRISAADNGSGVEGVYISICRVPEDGSYVVVYEVFDNAGNSTCVSETVYLR